MEGKENKVAMERGNGHEAMNVEQKEEDKRARRRRRLIKVCGGIIVLILVLFVVVLVLALTLFKPKDPKTEIISASVDGVSPRLTLPVIRVEINLTLDLKILVKNRNYAGFRHGAGKTLLMYRGDEVGEAELFPGNIPARRSATLPCRLTLEIDELGSDLISSLISDVLAGELVMETTTRIPGRITFLGFLKKHAVVVSVCRFTIGLKDLKVRSQDCMYKTKL